MQIPKKATLYVLLIFILGPVLYANNDLESRFLVGFKGGANVSHVGILQQYQIFSSLSSEELAQKEYYPIYRNLGYNYGFVGVYRLNNFINILIEPTFSHYTYGYEYNLEWTDAINTGFSRLTEQNHLQRLRYVEFPLNVQFYRDYSPIKPYVIVGAYYGNLLGAEKILDIDEYTVVDENRFQTTSNNHHAFFNEQYIKTRIAVNGGIGGIMDFTALLLMFDLTYHYNFNNITRENARFANQQLSGIAYDVNDDVRLNNLVFTLKVLFPLNKPSNLIKSLKCQ